MFDVILYPEDGGDQPLLRFLRELKQDPKRVRLHNLLLAALYRKIEREEHHESYIETVDPANGVSEVCQTDVDTDETACVLLFFAPMNRIVLMNGYMKRWRRVDPWALDLARRYKVDWEARQRSSDP